MTVDSGSGSEPGSVSVSRSGDVIGDPERDTSTPDGLDWNAILSIIRKDMAAVRRSKAVLLPMLLVPSLMLIVLPAFIGAFTARSKPVDVTRFLGTLPAGAGDPILALPEHEQLVVLVMGYLLAPLFLIVPLMVCAVLAADAFAGEKERRTLETILHLPIRDRDLYVAKLLVAYIPAVAVSWLGFLAYSLVANAVSWSVMERVFVPTRMWLVLIVWVSPAVGAVGLGVMVRISAWARTAQEANQLGGAVILPIIFVAMGQATGLLLIPMQAAVFIGALLWAVAAGLVITGARRFTRDRLASRA